MYIKKKTCLLTIAPIWLPLGRLWKYFSDSSSDTFCTGPSTLTYRPTNDVKFNHTHLGNHFKGYIYGS